MILTKRTNILTSLYCLLLGTCFKVYGQQASIDHPPEKAGNYYWVDIGLTNTSFNGGTPGGSIGVNVALDHHLFSVSFGDHARGMQILGESDDPKLEHFNLAYGYIKKYQHSFYAAKIGLSYVSYAYVIGSTPGSGWFGNPDYHFREINLLAVPVELSGVVKYKFIGLGASVGALLGDARISNGYIGLKLLIGDLN